MAVNLKRVRRLYREELLMVRRRKRKKVALADRQPLLRPSRQNEVWSVDFVFDRLADGRSLKCLTGGRRLHARSSGGASRSVDVGRLCRAHSGALEARARVAEGDSLRQTGVSSVQGDDDLAHENGVALRFIEPGKPNQNAYVECVQRAPARRMPE